MGVYLVKRLLLILPTLLGIMTINFLIVQTAPGGPVDRVIMQLRGLDAGATERITQSGSETGASTDMDATTNTAYEGARGLDPEFIAELEKQFGFDKPLHERYIKMLWDYARFDFGVSYYQDRGVLELVAERIPISISLGFWSLMLSYLISIPLGIRKAVRDGSPFDVWTSAAIFMGYAIPSFLLAIFLIVIFCGGNYLNLFPLRGLVSPNWADLSLIGKVKDYIWHIVLPISAIVVGQFAMLTMLTKNLFLEEISKQFVLTARAKGLSEKRVLYGHVFRNAMLIVIAGMPGAFVGVLFVGALLIEVIFSLNGMGLLGYEAAINRDYPILFGTVYIFTLISLVMHLVGDVVYTLVDPRIDFETRET